MPEFIYRLTLKDGDEHDVPVGTDPDTSSVEAALYEYCKEYGIYPHQIKRFVFSHKEE